MGLWGLRTRAVVDQYFGVIAVALVLLVVAGGVVAYDAHTGPNERTETTTETVVLWNSTGQFSHEATVVEDTRVFDAGETLTNRTQYFQRIAPTLEGAFAYGYTASNGSVAVNASVALVTRSVTEDGNEQWQVTEPLNRAERTLAPDESVQVPFEQNVTEVETELETIRSELGTTAGTAETFFEATVRLDGTRGGEAVETTQSYQLPLTIEDGLYRVNDTGPVDDEGEVTVRDEETVPVTVGPLRSYGGPLLAVVGLGGLIGLSVGRRTDWFEVSERERDYLAYRADRNEFDEWITEVNRPIDRLADADTQVGTATLAGLVDLAIDTDRRVLETSAEQYLVFENDVVYSYEPPTLADDRDPLREADGSVEDSNADQSGLLGGLLDSEGGERGGENTDSSETNTRPVGDGADEPERDPDE